MCLSLSPFFSVLASPVPSPTPKSYSLGFDKETQLLRDFALSAQVRAQAVGNDFAGVANMAKKFEQEEVERERQQEKVLASIEKAKERRMNNALVQAEEDRNIANQQVAELSAKVAKMRQNVALLAGNKATEAAARAAVSHARHAALTATPLPAATAKLAAKAAAPAKSSLKSAFTSALKSAVNVAPAAASAVKSAVQATPVGAAAKSAAATPAGKSLLQTQSGAAVTAEAALLAVESPTLKIPSWPSLSDPANVAAEVLIRSRGAPAVFKQPDMQDQKNLEKFPKFSGRQSYTEHFKEWPKAKPAAVQKSISDFKKLKFLKRLPTKVKAQPVVAHRVRPRPAVRTKSVPKNRARPILAAAAPKAEVTTAAARVSKTAVVTPTPVVASTEKKPFPWWIVAVVGGSLFLCLCGAAVYMQLRKKSQADVEVDGYHQV
jgi:hypothetical protein